jgi:hypothetical protein
LRDEYHRIFYQGVDTGVVVVAVVVVAVVVVLVVL